MSKAPSSELVAALFARERERFAAAHPRSRELHERAQGSLLSGVPMNWMTRWPGQFPIFISEAHGAALADVDGNSYVDLCLGDTGAMSGHSPPAAAAAVAERAARGITTMLPSEDAIAVGEEMRRRFGLAAWQFTLSATDANRFAIRICRQITGRPKVLVFNHCYHGTVDETFATLSGNGGSSRGPATSDRRSRSPRRRGWSSSTTPPGWSRRSATATSPACSPSRR